MRFDRHDLIYRLKQSWFFSIFFVRRRRSRRRRRRRRQLLSLLIQIKRKLKRRRMQKIFLDAFHDLNAQRKIFSSRALDLRTSNVSLPLELGSDRRQTSAMRVSDDLQLSIFRCRKQNFGKIFGSKSQFFVNLMRFWRTYGRTDVKISFLVKFCSR